MPGMRHQPQAGPARVGSAYMAMGLNSAYMLAGSRPMELTGRYRTAVTGTLPTRTIGRAGLAMSFNASQGQQFNTPLGALSFGTKFSKFAVLTVSSNSDVQTISSTAGQGGAQFRLNAGSLELLNSGTAVIISIYHAVPVGETATFGVTYDGATVRLFVDGRELGSAPCTTDFIESGFDTGIGQRYSGNENFNGQIYLHLDFNRGLTPQAAKSLTAGVWQVFQLPDEDDPVPSAAAAGNTYTLAAVKGTFALTGPATGLRASRRLAAATGSFSLAGTAVTLRRGRTMAAATGAFTLLGQGVGLRTGRRLTAALGAFSLTGLPAGLRTVKSLTANPGSFALAGYPAVLRQGHVAPASAGAFALTGQATTLRRGRTMPASTGAFSLAGSTAALRQGHVLPAAQGAYALTGAQISFVSGRTLAAVSGNYAHVGVAVALRASRRLTASTGGFGLTGIPLGVTVRQMTASAGAFALNGVATRLAAGRSLTGTAGQFTSTGFALRAVASRRLVASPGAMSLAGGGLVLTAGRRLTAQAGAYQVLGASTALRLARKLPVTRGTYSLSGYAVGSGIAPTVFRATILVGGILRVATQTDVGQGRAPIVLVDGRLRQRVAGEGTPVVTSNLGGRLRYRLLRANEALEI